MTRVQQMRAVRFDAFGGPEVLEIRRVDVPQPGSGEVLVRVQAAGLNPKDSLFRSKPMGLRARSGFPRGTGFDFAGEVAGVGEGVGDLQEGQRVWGFLDGIRGGAAADYLVAARDWMAIRPESLDALEAASLPLVGSAALQALRDVARLRPGERMLVKGASGGVGSAAVQIGKALGAHVTAISSGLAGTRCRELGADRVWTHEELLRKAPRAGFDVFLDCAGSSAVSRFAKLLAPRGRWVTVAPNPTVFALAPLSWLISRSGAPRFGYLIVRPRADDLEWLGQLVANGTLRPGPVAPFDLEDVRAAHLALTERGRSGRPVLAIDPEACFARAAADGPADRRDLTRGLVEGGAAW